jgi:opacity protein-like surface antigen
MRKLSVLAVLMAALLALSATASANFEFYGGASYVTVQPEVLNDLVEIVKEKVDELDKPEGHDLKWADDKELKEIKSGFGAFGGLRYWVDPSVAVGGELEYISVGSSGTIEGNLGEAANVQGTFDISAPVFGYGANVAYKVSPEFLVFGGAGYYNLNGSVETKGLEDAIKKAYENDEGIDEFEDGKATLEDSAFGFKAGASYTYPVSDDFSVTARAAYRMLKFEEVEVKADDQSWDGLLGIIEEVEEGFELDFSGFEVGLGVVLYF